MPISISSVAFFSVFAAVLTAIFFERRQRESVRRRDHLQLQAIRSMETVDSRRGDADAIQIGRTL
jgi:hypothetical protein